METVGGGLDVVAGESIGKSLEPFGRLHGVRRASQGLGGGIHISVAPKRRGHALFDGFDAILGRTMMKDGNMVPGDATGLSHARMDLVPVCQELRRLISLSIP